MNLRRLRHLLTGICLLSGIGALASIVLPLAMPPALQSPTIFIVGTSRPTTSPTLSLSAYEPIWKLNLKQEATSIATKPPVPTTTDASTTGLSLVGTIGSELAMVKSATGLIELHAVGDTIAAGKIISIRPYEIIIQTAAGPQSITKPRPPEGNP